MTTPSFFQRAAALTLTALLGGAVMASPQEIAQQAPSAATAPDIEAQADHVLRSMSEYLEGAQELSFRADIVYDSVSDDGRELQYGGVARISARRPDRLRVLYDGDERPRQATIAGEAFTMLDREANVYFSARVPSELGAAIDHVFESYGYHPKRSIRDRGTGAMEVGFRFSRIVLDDQKIAGGTLNDWSAAFNWYPTYHLKLMFNAMLADLKGAKPVGIFQMRLQVSY